MASTTRHETERLDRFTKRAAGARNAAAYMRAALIVAVLTAAWQDRAFWPFVHDRMQLGYAMALDLYGKRDEARGRIANLTNFRASGGSNSENNVVVDTLLKLKE